MLISVDTAKDSPADLRAAAALILSIAGAQDASQKHPFPPLHEEHGPIESGPEQENTFRSEPAYRNLAPGFTSTPAAAPASPAAREHAQYSAPTAQPKMQVPLTQSRRIADLLAEVENGSSESNNAAADVDTDNFEPEPKKRVIPKEIGADNEFVSRADRRNDKRAEVTQDKSSEESVKPLVRRIPPGVQVY